MNDITLKAKKELQTKLNDVAKLFKSNNFNDLETGLPGKKLLYLYSLYHYFYGDDDRLLDVIDGCRYTIDFSDKAQACFEPDSYDEKEIDILSVYDVDEEETFNINEVLSILLNIQGQVAQIKLDKYYQNENSIIKDHIDSDSDEEVITIRVLTNYIPEYDEKKKYFDTIDRQSPMFKFIRFELLFGDDILDEIVNLTSDKQAVEKGELNIDSPNNVLHYGSEDSIIVNVSALSLKDNYIRYGKAGLFSSNLRFYVPNKKIDADIENSIRNKGDKFWYYNNGIIIVCDDYEIVDGKIKLYNFSIVNGGQTTRMIGVVPFSDDFYISCKVIRNNDSDSQEKIKFVSEVAEASNTQKKINSTDLIANRPEQRFLKSNLADHNIFVQIKRGDAAAANKKVNYPAPWQSTTNAELGQIIYASVYQHPGTARNSKDKIFSDKKKYNTIFGNYDENKYSYELIKDLLFIRSYYKEWAKSVSKDNNADATKKGLVKNGTYFFNAAIVLMAKLYYSKELVNEIKTQGIQSDRSKALLQSRTFNHRIFNDEYDELKSRMFELFQFVYDKYISRGFNQLKNVMPELSYSNFTKTDKNYENQIMTQVFDDFSYEVSNAVLKITSKLFYQENATDSDISSELLVNAIERFESTPVEVDEDVDPIAETLKEAITAYRTTVYKSKGIKAYMVFSNAELENLVNTKPRTVDELRLFSCFQKKPFTKIKLYGEDIVSIIVSICGPRITK